MFKAILILFIVFCVGCEQRPRERHYTQVLLEPTSSPTEEGALSWRLPQGWVEEKNESQMRMATFRLAADPDAFDCSIVLLPGGAGGLEANLKRWMGQIKLEAGDEEFKQFINRSSNNVFDFSKLQVGQEPQTESMIAAMIELNNQTIFVKLKGTSASVTANKKEFLSLSSSVKSK